MKDAKKSCENTGSFGGCLLGILKIASFLVILCIVFLAIKDSAQSKNAKNHKHKRCDNVTALVAIEQHLPAMTFGMDIKNAVTPQGNSPSDKVVDAIRMGTNLNECMTLPNAEQERVKTMSASIADVGIVNEYAAKGHLLRIPVPKGFSVAPQKLVDNIDNLDSRDS